MGTIRSRDTSDSEKPAGYLNVSAVFLDKDGNEHVVPGGNAVRWPLYESRKVHRVLLKNCDKVIEDKRVQLKVTSINPVVQEDGEDLDY